MAAKATQDLQWLGHSLSKRENIVEGDERDPFTRYINERLPALDVYHSDIIVMKITFNNEKSQSV